MTWNKSALIAAVLKLPVQRKSASAARRFLPLVQTKDPSHPDSDNHVF
jgi:hypothetical protein